MPETVSHTVKKVWEDSDDTDQLRPESILVQLYADKDAYGERVKLTADMDWSYMWEELPEKREGTVITYSVQEAAVPSGYTAEISESGTLTVITNVHEPETQKITETEPTTDTPGTEPATEKPKTDPKTPAMGDNTNVLLWTVALLLAMMGMGGALRIWRRKRGRRS